MNSDGTSPVVALGILGILVVAVAGFAVVLSGGLGGGLTGDFVDVLPYIAVPLLIVAVFLILRGGG